MTDLEREIFDDIDRLFGKIAELQRQQGFQCAAHPLGVIESSLRMAHVEQQRQAGQPVPQPDSMTRQLREKLEN